MKHLEGNSKYKFEDFEVVRPLSSNSNSEVLLCHQKKKKGCGSIGILSAKHVVLKKLHIPKIDDELLYNEITACTVVKHSGIVKLHTFWKEKDDYFILMEYVNGMDLFAFMEKSDFTPLKEKVARKHFLELLSSVLYLHRNGIAHRDIKMENIIITEQEKVKLIDFGLCTFMSKKAGNTEGDGDEILSTRWCGSEDYVCPEILQQKPYSGIKADVWSMGVVLYIMLFGELPFSFKARAKAILKGTLHPTVKFVDEEDSSSDLHVSDSAKDLLRKMLCVDPQKRISSEEVAKHKWIVGNSLQSTIQRTLQAIPKVLFAQA